MNIQIVRFLILTATLTSGLVADEVDFCVDLASSQIALGEQTAVVAVVWNRSGSEGEYTLEVNTPKPRFSEYPAFGSMPDVRKIGAHSVDIRIFRVPLETLFDSTSAGDYRIDVSFTESATASQTADSLKLVLTIGETDVKNGFFLRPVSADVRGQPLEAFSLDGSAHLELRNARYEEILGWRDPMDQAVFFSGLKEWYSTPEGHYGFGEPEDWFHELDGSGSFALIRDLECLLDGAYCLNESEYFERYVAQYEARLRYGISPYYEIKQVVQILRDSGKQASLEYLSSIDTAGWRCYEKILLSYVSDRIRSTSILGVPKGLVYSAEVAPLKRGADGRLYQLGKPPSE